MFFQATRFPTSTTPICHLQRSQVKRLPDIPVFDSGRLFVPIEQGEDVEEVIQEVRHTIAPLENPAPEPEPKYEPRPAPKAKVKSNRQLFQQTIMKEAFKQVHDHPKLKGKAGNSIRFKACNTALNKFKDVYEDPNFESFIDDANLVQDFADELEAQLDKA